MKSLSYEQQDEPDDIFKFWQSELSSLTLATVKHSNRQQSERRPNSASKKNQNEDLYFQQIEDDEDDDEFNLPLIRNISLLKERTIQNVSIQQIENSISHKKSTPNSSSKKFPLLQLDRSEDYDENPSLFYSNFHLQTDRSIPMKSILDLNSRTHTSGNKLHHARSMINKKSTYCDNAKMQENVSKSYIIANNRDMTPKQFHLKDPQIISKLNHEDRIDQLNLDLYQDTPKKNNSFEDLTLDFQYNLQEVTLNTETQQNENQPNINNYQSAWDEDLQKILYIPQVYQRKEEFRICLLKLYKNKYRIYEFISKGSKGLVFSGYHIENSQKIAIKFTHCQNNQNNGDPNFQNLINNIQEYLEEYHKSMKVIKDFAYLIKLHSYFIHNQTIVQVMGLGYQDLEKFLLIRRNNPMSISEKVNIILQLINSLIEIHTNGIVHLNIQPGNILMNEKGNIKLTDLGISPNYLNLMNQFKQETSNLYYSPEQFTQKNNNSQLKDEESNVNEKSDIFSMGLMFLKIIGVKLKQDQIHQIRNGQWDQIQQHNIQKKLFNFIRFHMLCCDPIQRKPALLLQNIFIKMMEEEIDFGQENERIKVQINLHKGQLSSKKYLSYLYCLEGQTYSDCQIKHQYFYSSIIVSKQIVDFCKVDHFYFSCQFALNLLKSNNIQRGKSILQESVDLLQNIQLDQKQPLLIYSTFQLGESFLILQDYHQAIKYHLKSLQMKEQLFQNNPHLDIIDSLIKISEIYQQINEIQQSLEYNLRALSLTDELFQEANPDIVSQLNKIGNTYYELKQFKEALQYYNRSLQMRESLQESDYEDIINVSFKIGKIYIKLNNYEESLQFMLKVLEMREAYLQENTSNLKVILRYLSYIYFRMNDKIKSLDYYIRALMMGDKPFKYGDFNEADSLIYVAELYEKLGDNKKAIEYYLESLQMREQIDQKDHLNSIQTLNRIGRLHQKQNEDHRAIQYFLQSLSMGQKLFKGDYSDIILSLNYLGISYLKVRSYNQALQYYQKLLKLQEHNLKSDQLDIALTLNKIGKIYEKQGQTILALQEYTRVLEIQQNAIKEDHPDTADTLNNIGQLYFQLSNFYRARQFFNNGLQMRQKVYKEDHPRLAESLNNMSLICSRLKDYQNSQMYCLKALEMNLRLYKQDHPYIIQSYQNLAILSSSTKDYSKSVEYYQSSLLMQENIFKEGHPKIGVTLHQIGLQNQKLGDYQKACEFHTKAIQMIEKFKVSKCSQPAINLFNLAAAYAQQGDEQKAQEYYQQALQITETLFQ